MCIRDSSLSLPLLPVAGTRTLLEHYWKVYPHSKVMQCGYDIPCEKGGCIHTDDSR